MKNAHDLAELAEWLKTNAARPIELDVPGEDGESVPFLVTIRPDGGHAINSLKPLIDEMRTRPDRYRGTAQFFDVASFIAHVKRQSMAHSVIFAQTGWPNPAITAVYDYNDPALVSSGWPAVGTEDEPPTPVMQDGLPRFGTHRAVYAFPVSKEWTAWTSKSGVKMSQKDFAEFIEDNILDIVAAPIESLSGLGADLIKAVGGRYADAATLVELSRGLTVHSADRVKNATNISSGEVQVVFENEHRDAQGAPLVVPSLFMIGIPVFEGEACYMVAARLRYSVSGGTIGWWFDLFKHQKVAEHAVSASLAMVREETGLPVFVCHPEK